ncbi:MAG: aldo/keto reductase [Lachnospiraceae bacterium]|nr:aldo/keto reductase [Lachnospiraceae bacterium]
MINTVERLGFGCYLPKKSREEATEIIVQAIECGYRYFDTASFYETERSLGEAIAKTGINREEISVASKLWIDEKGYDGAKAALYRTLDRLGLDYIDTYLIHWPKSSVDDNEWREINAQTFVAMLELKKEGVVKNIGTSNFLPHHISVLLENNHIPVVNQLELHPGYVQSAAVSFCENMNISVQAWSPLGRGAVLEDKFLATLSKKYGKTVAQLCLIYLLQKNIMPIVKASAKERLLENRDIFDVSMETEDIMMIDSMPQTGWSGEHPDFIIPQKKSNFNQ